MDKNEHTFFQHMALGLLSASRTYTQLTVGSGTYNSPIICKAILVECWGAGSGGGGAASAAGSSAAASGAGSGGYGAKFILIPQPYASVAYDYVVGAGGAGGAAGNNNGSAGGDTTFAPHGGAVVCSGLHGGVGVGAPAGTGVWAVSGNFGGAAGVGDLVIPGGPGTAGIALSSQVASSGNGGQAPRGGGGGLGVALASGASSSVGGGGLLPGGGGAGAVVVNAGAAKAGGAGANGLIIVTEFY